MKQLQRFYIFAITMLAAAGVTHADTLLIGVSDSNPGAVEYKNGRFYGKAGNPYQCFIDKIEIPHRILVAPNSRLFPMFKQNQLDVILPLAKTPERDEMGTFARTLLEADFVIYSRHEALDVTNLKGAKIVSLWAAASNARIKAYGGDLIEVKDYIQGVAMTQANRVDGVVFPEPAIGPLKEHLEGLHRHHFFKQEISMYVQTQKPHAIDAINQAIDLCTQVAM